MRKTIITALGLLSLVFAGTAVAQETLKMATIAPGSSAYQTMTTFANIVNKGQEAFEITVDATGTATKHMLEVAEGKLDMSLTSPAVYTFMRTGTRMYKKMKKAPELAKNLRLIFWFPYGSYHIAVYADSGMEKIEDIKGKKVFLGPPGGGAWNTANGIVNALTGYRPKEDYENVKASWSSAFQGFQDRQFDVYITGCIDPCPQFEQITVTNTIRFLGATAADQDRLNRAIVPGRVKGIIKKNAYGDKQDNTEDIYTVGAIVGVTVRSDLPEETIYSITKTFWEGVKVERSNTPWLSDITLDFAVQKGPMKLHPGAFKYYEEIGLKVPAINRP